MSQQQYDNTNRFTVWKNDTPKKDERDPDYSGTLNVDGQEFYIDGWVRKTQAGKAMMSGRIKPKNQQRGARQPQPPQRQQSADPIEDDIPFK